MCAKYGQDSRYVDLAVSCTPSVDSNRQLPGAAGVLGSNRQHKNKMAALRVRIQLSSSEISMLQIACS